MTGSEMRPAAMKWFTNVFVSLSLGVGALMLWLGMTSLTSLYRGEPDPHAPSRVHGVVAVGDCWRSGPISRYGFGYWWQCDVSVSLTDGRTIMTRLDRSIVKPSDRGNRVLLVESCSGPRRTKCVLARPGNYPLALALRIVRVVLWVGTGIATFVSIAFLLRYMLGQTLFIRIFGTRSRRLGRRPDPRFSLRSEPPTDITGTLFVEIQRSGPKGMYRDSDLPIATIGGQSSAATGWGLHKFDLAPGRHTIRVAVPQGMPNVVDSAEYSFTIASGQELVLSYHEPSSAGIAGHFEQAGGTVRRKISLLRVAVGVAVILVVVYLAWYLSV